MSKTSAPRGFSFARAGAEAAPSAPRIGAVNGRSCRIAVEVECELADFADLVSCAGAADLPAASAARCSADAMGSDGALDAGCQG